MRVPHAPSGTLASSIEPSDAFSAASWAIPSPLAHVLGNSSRDLATPECDI